MCIFLVQTVTVHVASNVFFNFSELQFLHLKGRGRAYLFIRLLQGWNKILRAISTRCSILTIFQALTSQAVRNPTTGADRLLGPDGTLLKGGTNDFNLWYLFFFCYLL